MRRVIQHCQRKYHTFAYIAVWELHATGVPHLHMLLSRPLPIKTKYGYEGAGTSAHAVHDYAHSVGFGFMAEQTAIARGSKKNAAAYVAKLSKYLSKTGHLLPKNARRVSASHGLIEALDKSADDWEVRERGQDWLQWAANVDERGIMPALDALTAAQRVMLEYPDGIQGT
jgi:hypothetical protein